METTKKDYDGSKRQKNGKWTKNPAREKAKENNDKYFLRFCKKCNEESKWYTIGNHCVKCVRENGLRQNLMPEVIERSKWRHIQSKYGLNKDEWYWMYKEQGGKCLMCEEEMLISSPTKGGPSSMTACIDHDHKTGKIGGMLHSRCNIVIGFAQDDVNLLQLGIIYLNEANGINDI